MDRPSRRMIRIGWALLLCTAATGALSGCSMLATALWAVRGSHVPPEFEGMKEKRVAVVCRPQYEMQYATSRAADELAQSVETLLQANVKKIEVVDHDKIAEWTDEHDWDAFTEVGKAVDADLVLGIELNEYKLYSSQTIYQGQGRATIKVYDMTKGGELVFMKQMPRSLYPPNIGVPVNDVAEAEFNWQFVRVLADEIGRHFYPHDPRADIGRDGAALQR